MISRNREQYVDFCKLFTTGIAVPPTIITIIIIIFLGEEICKLTAMLIADIVIAPINILAVNHVKITLHTSKALYQTL